MQTPTLNKTWVINMALLKYYCTILLRIIIFSAGFLVADLIIVSCGKSETANEAPGLQIPVDTTINKPALTGKLVYHSYSCYNCNDSKLILYDFVTNTNIELSAHWKIQNPMNAHFSPDGNKIVFMGIDPNSNRWHIFLWHIGDTAQPVNLTSAFNSRNEDPKFSSDGLSIIFKCSGRLTRIDTLGNLIAQYTVSQKEASMPYFINHDQNILYAAEKDDISSLYSYNIQTTNINTIFDTNGIYAYYPITITDSSFIFTRWYSATNHHDQLYIGYLNSRSPVALPFNEATGDYSDAYPVNSKYILLSSTRSDTKGGYDLYIADITTGIIWSLSNYNSSINTNRNELGSAYHE